jgi:hypothetical protein
MTISVLLVLDLCLPHRFSAESPRLADDAAKDAGDAFLSERATVPGLNSGQYLSLATCVKRRQSASNLDRRQLTRDPGALVEQAHQFAIKNVDLMTTGFESVHVCVCWSSLDSHFLSLNVARFAAKFPKKQKPQLSELRLR